MAGTGPKIVLVGGGSYTWSPRLLCDMMHAPELEGSEVVLFDPDQVAAREVEAAGRTIMATLGRRLTLRATADARSAFRDADFVLITISTGGLDMMARDLAIPEKYGFLQTVGDTSGPGGWSRALRNVPVFVGLAQAVERFAPRAVVLNYTNPLSVLTATIAQTSRLRCVGLCHGVFADYRFLELFFGVREEDLSLSFGGVNHFFWITDFTVKGQPGYPALRRKLKGRRLGEAMRTQGDTDEIGFHSGQALTEELFMEYGYLPYVGDRHVCEFMPGYITAGAAHMKRFKLIRTTVAERRAGRRRARRWTLDLARGKLPPYPKSRETAVDMMKAVLLNRPFVDVVNLPNTGQIDNLPRGAVVETQGIVDTQGFRALQLGALPAAVQALVTPHCVVQKLTVEAALKGNCELALTALMLDPVCGHLPPSTVRAMGLELMEATKDWLPQFRRVRAVR